MKDNKDRNSAGVSWGTLTPYPEPIPQLAMANPYDIPPAVSLYEGGACYNCPQTYLQGFDGIKYGVGATDAWSSYGNYTHGETVTIIDIESGWNVDHEDLQLTAANVLYGINDYYNPSSFFYVHQHGTAVLGELVGYKNGYGVTGIAYKANIGLISVNNGRDSTPLVPEAISQATKRTGFGDIILIEQHYSGPIPYGWSCTISCGNCDQFGYIPVEYYRKRLINPTGGGGIELVAVQV